MATTVGIDCTPKTCAILGLASTSTFARIHAPFAACARRSSTGESCLHGPHHSAHRSTTTGTCSERSITSTWKVSSETSMTNWLDGRSAPDWDGAAAARPACALVASALAFNADKSTAPDRAADSSAVRRGLGLVTVSILARRRTGPSHSSELTPQAHAHIAVPAEPRGAGLAVQPEGQQRVHADQRPF